MAAETVPRLRFGASTSRDTYQPRLLSMPVVYMRARMHVTFFLFRQRLVHEAQHLHAVGAEETPGEHCGKTEKHDVEVGRVVPVHGGHLDLRIAGGARY